MPAISIVRFWCVTISTCDVRREPLHEPQEPVQVHVVERRLHLVHQVERAMAAR